MSYISCYISAFVFGFDKDVRFLYTMFSRLLFGFKTGDFEVSNFIFDTMLCVIKMPHHCAMITFNF